MARCQDPECGHDTEDHLSESGACDNCNCREYLSPPAWRECVCGHNEDVHGKRDKACWATDCECSWFYLPEDCSNPETFEAPVKPSSNVCVCGHSRRYHGDKPARCLHIRCLGQVDGCTAYQKAPGPTPGPKSREGLGEPLGAATEHVPADVQALDALGLRATSEMRAQADVLFRALRLYEGRSGERGEIWRGSGVKGMTFHLMAKSERAFRQGMSGQLPNDDHFIDIINYAAFAIRLGEDLNGRWPWHGEDES